MSQSEEALAEGEVVLLWGPRGERTLLPLRRGSQTVEGQGVLRMDEHIGRPPGGTVEWGGRDFRVLRPTLGDRLAQLKRRAQIVTPKDAQYLLYLAGISPGTVVAEAGSGSGALTLVLAEAVGQDGRVVSFDRRPDFLRVAQENLAASGLADRVRFVERDVARDGFGDAGFDAVVLDLAEPWTVVPGARPALVMGGRVVTYTPTYNQLERTVRSLREAGFEAVRSVEILERELHVGEGGTRPEFEMLGHTGFLTGARKVR